MAIAIDNKILSEMDPFLFVSDLEVSHHANFLAANVRFATRYLVDGFDKAAFAGLLTADVGNLSHMRYTLNTGRMLLGESPVISEGRKLTPEQINECYLTQAGHDCGEALVLGEGLPFVGDTAYTDDKAGGKRTAEMEVCKWVVTDILTKGRDCRSWIDANIGSAEEAAEHVAFAAGRITGNDNTVENAALGVHFDPEVAHVHDVIERVGFFQTALAAASVKEEDVVECADKLGIDPNIAERQFDAFNYLGALVSVYHLPLLIAEANAGFVGLRSFLRGNSEDIVKTLSRNGGIIKTVERAEKDKQWYQSSMPMRDKQNPPKDVQDIMAALV